MTKGHALAQGVRLKAEACRIATVVKEGGEAVSYMNCRLRNAGAQFFSMRLPRNARLWGAYVEAKPVSPNRTKEGVLVVPILEAPRGRAFGLSVIWSEPARAAGFGHELALVSPKLDLPAEQVDWDVFLPEEYEVVRTAGNMKMLERKPWQTRGLAGAVGGYARRIWRPLKGILIVVAWALVAVGFAWLSYAAIRHVVRERRARRAAGGEGKKRLRVSWVTMLALLAVVAVLASLLLPALSPAREAARGLRSLTPDYVLKRTHSELGVKARVYGAPSAALEPESASVEKDTETQREVAEKRELQQKAKRVADRRGRFKDALQLAESYRKRGDYDQAGEQLRRAERNAPEGGEASREIRLKTQQMQAFDRDEKGDTSVPAADKPALSGRGPEPAEERRQETYDAAALLAYAGKLAAANETDDWQEEAVENDQEKDILELVTGRGGQFALKSGGKVVFADGALVIEGTKDEVQGVQETAGRLRKRMLEHTRTLAQAQQAHEAEVAARRRARMKQVKLAQEVRQRRSGGTITGNRDAGAMPLEISFPSAGTSAYPFHMDYAGISQARIEMTCMRASAAMVVEGALVLLVFAAMGMLSWRSLKAGLPAAVLLALALVFALHTAGEAPKPYIIMALAGLCLAAPVLLVRVVGFLTTAARGSRRTATD